MPNRGLPRILGGLRKREREAWEKPCPLPNCGKPAAGIIHGITGPRSVCEGHIPAAKRLGYKVYGREGRKL